MNQQLPKKKNRSGKEASTHHNLKVITQTHEFKYFKLTILVAKLLESTGKVKNVFDIIFLMSFLDLKKKKSLFKSEKT